MNRAALTLADVARFPRPGTVTPVRCCFTPDGAGLTYLAGEGGSLQRALHHLDLATGQTRCLLRAEDVGAGTLTPAEALLRERLRRRDTGITDYTWAAQAAVMVVPLGGQIGVWRDGQLRLRAAGDSNAVLSPDGAHLYYTRQDALYTTPADEGPERLLAQHAGRSVGLAEYVAQEEMSRYEGFWLSPDGAHIAYAEVDESHIPLLSIPRYAGEPGAAELHRYPFAGADNATVRLFVVPTAGGPARPITLPPFEYLARVKWEGPTSLLVQVQPRDQRTLDLLRVNLRRGTVTLLRRETADCWVNLHNDLRVLPDRTLLWSTEETGFRHLVVLGPAGGLRRRLTAGDWAVDRVVAVADGGVFFLGSVESPLERHLYRVPLAGGPVERLSPNAGCHEAVVHPAGHSFVLAHDARQAPPSVAVFTRTGPPRVLHAADPAIDLPAPDLFTFQSRDGATLHASLFQPAGPGPWPLIVSVYGGPHVQGVQESWLATIDLRSQLLCARGYAVLEVDNRGSARRGLAFEGAIYRRMGSVEVDDQVDGVRHLVAQGLVDPARVGVCGWSYGGYMSLLCLAKAPDTFAAACAGAPVTEWEGYDTHYTERYMSTPAENPDGYKQSSVLTHIGGIRGKLLLLHGLIDENVHFRHSARLIDAMGKAGIPLELLLFPDERHMPRSEADRMTMEARIFDFFDRSIGPGARPLAP